TSGTPALNSTLKGPDFNGWTVYDTRDGVGHCKFTGGALHASETKPGDGIIPCIALATNFSNFAYQVQMTIIKGDIGGLLFRSDLSNSKGYILLIGQDGSYELLVFTTSSQGRGQIVVSGSTTALTSGQNQPN